MCHFTHKTELRYITPMDSSKYRPYYQAIQYLESLNNISGSYQMTNLIAHPHPGMYLERMQDFLDMIGNPEKRFKYIHITGTAGKGSVSSIVQSTLTAKGKKTGLFTSPFVVSTIEKIQVGKKYIDPIDFANILESIKPLIDAMTLSSRHGMPSYFEIIFAIALIYFKKEKCEYAVLEVGLGGRYDATNIIEKPLVTAITNIGLDHTQILGTTIEKIAYDKSGIIKKASHFFTTEDNNNLLSIFKKECENVQAEFNQCVVIELDYNQKNRLLAGSICADLGIIKSPENVCVPDSLPARFEIINKNLLIIIDGAHNPSKIASTIYNLENHSYKKFFLVVAISADKDWKTMLKILLPKTDKLYITRFNVQGRQCVDLKILMKFARKYHPPCQILLFTDPIQAFNEAKESMRKNDALLVTGSFFLAGNIRKLYCPEERILKQRNIGCTRNFR